MCAVMLLSLLWLPPLLAVARYGSMELFPREDAGDYRLIAMLVCTAMLVVDGVCVWLLCRLWRGAGARHFRRAHRRRVLAASGALLLVCSYYGMFFHQFTVSSDYALGRVPYPIGPNTFVVRRFSSTGPTYYVVKGAGHIRLQLPEAWSANSPLGYGEDLAGIELTGLPLEGVGPGYTNRDPDYLVQGRLGGTTLPVLKVEEAHQLTTVAGYLLMGESFPRALGGAAVLFVWIVVIPLALVVAGIRWLVLRKVRLLRGDWKAQEDGPEFP